MKLSSSALLLLCFYGIGFADVDETRQKASTENDAAIEKPEEKQYVSEHSMRIGGKNISYTVTAGSMLMNNKSGEPQALVGFTAYVAKGANQAERPVIFAYNGGPGSASLRLQMGILGPQRAVVTDTGWHR